MVSPPNGPRHEPKAYGKAETLPRPLGCRTTADSRHVQLSTECMALQLPTVRSCAPSSAATA